MVNPSLAPSFAAYPEDHQPALSWSSQIAFKPIRRISSPRFVIPFEQKDASRGEVYPRKKGSGSGRFLAG